MHEADFVEMWWPRCETQARGFQRYCRALAIEVEDLTSIAITAVLEAWRSGERTDDVLYLAGKRALERATAKERRERKHKGDGFITEQGVNLSFERATRSISEAQESTDSDLAVRRHSVRNESEPKNEDAVALGRRGGLRGGRSRAMRLSPEQRSETARKAAEARWQGWQKQGRIVWRRPLKEPVAVLPFEPHSAIELRDTMRSLLTRSAP